MDAATAGREYGNSGNRRTLQQEYCSSDAKKTNLSLGADGIVLVMDNLNTRKKASLYEAFEPTKVKHIADKLEIHYTPRDGSAVRHLDDWLNMAEIEMSVMSRQCLTERMVSIERLEGEALAWVEKRNVKEVKVDWRFTTADARIKLKKPYPSIDA